MRQEITTVFAIGTTNARGDTMVWKLTLACGHVVRRDRATRAGHPSGCVDCGKCTKPAANMADCPEKRALLLHPLREEEKP
jgi:hypothetical protein